MSAAAQSPRPVFVHGNPETAAIWGPLRSVLDGRGCAPSVALSPPGFGAPLPPGFDASAGAYLVWLVDELERVASDGPIDLVGHDWGAGHVYRLVAERPDLVRSWAADVGGLLHPEYRWHDAAQAWRTPGVGEEVMGAMVGMPTDDLAAAYLALGMTDDIAGDCAAAMNDEMASAILALYRSAPEAELRRLGDHLAATQSTTDGTPGAIIGAAGDEYVPIELGRDVAERCREAGADVTDLTLEGVGHWWMIEAPERAGEELLGFWADRVGLRPT